MLQPSRPHWSQSSSPRLNLQERLLRSEDKSQVQCYTSKLWLCVSVMGSSEDLFPTGYREVWHLSYWQPVSYKVWCEWDSSALCWYVALCSWGPMHGCVPPAEGTCTGQYSKGPLHYTLMLHGVNISFLCFHQNQLLPLNSAAPLVEERIVGKQQVVETAVRLPSKCLLIYFSGLSHVVI